MIIAAVGLAASMIAGAVATTPHEEMKAEIVGETLDTRVRVLFAKHC